MRWHRKHFRQTLSKIWQILNPRTINKDGSIHYVPIDDWCSGFFPGNIWYTYELTGDKSGYRWQRSILKHWIPYNILLGIMM